MHCLDLQFFVEEWLKLEESNNMVDEKFDNTDDFKEKRTYIKLSS